MNKFGTLIRKIDYFGMSMKLSFNKEDKFRTILGGIITLLILALALTIFINLSSNLVNRKQPKTNYFEDRQISAPIINLKKMNIILSVGYLDVNFDHLYDPTYFDFFASEFSAIKYDNGSSYFGNKPLKLTSCSDFKENYTKSGFEKDYVNNNVEFGRCLDPPDDINIGGDFTTNFFANIQFSVLKCVNSTNSKIICKSKEQIAKKIAGGYFLFYYTNRYLNLENYTSPFTEYFTNYFIVTDPNTHKFVEIFFKNVIVTSDSGLIFPSVSTESNLVFDRFREQFDTFTPNSILDFYVNSSNNISFYSRFYMKIQDLSATLGGILNICMLIGLLITRTINTFKMNEIILNTLFNFKEKKNEIQSNSIILECNLSRNYFLKLQEKSKFFKKNETIIKDNKSISVLENRQVSSSNLKTNNFFVEKTDKNLNLEKANDEEAGIKIFQKLADYKENLKSELKLSYFQILCLVLCCGVCNKKLSKKKEILDLGKAEMNKYLDYLEIIKLLQEFKKLKMILLVTHQRTLFNNFTKPLICNNIGKNSITQIKYEFELENVINFEKLYIAYCASKNENFDKLNNKLVEYFDPDIKHIFDKVDQKF